MIRLAVSLALLLVLGASAGAQAATMGEGTPTLPLRRRTITAVSSRGPSMITSFPLMAGCRERLASSGRRSAISACLTAIMSGRPWRTPLPRQSTPGQRVDFLRFGPMAQEGRYERFAFFPDVHGTGARQLRRFLATEDEALLKPGALREQSAAVQGLPALESLLFSGSKALLDAEDAEPYRCALAAKDRRQPERDSHRSARRVGEWRELGDADRKSGIGESRLPLAFGSDDRDSPRRADRPRTASRPSPAACGR